MMSRIEKLRWLVARLRAMSLEEIRWRVRMQGVKSRWKKAVPQPTHQPDRHDLERMAALPFYGLPSSIEGWKTLAASIPAHELKALIDEANLYLERKWLFFAFGAGEQPASNVNAAVTDWHQCDRSGLRGNPDAFGPDYDYRDAKLVGNVKYTWEKSRHHHTTVLALAYALTGEDRYARAAWVQIEDWIAKNPAPRGINWASALEVGERIMAWAWVFHLLKFHPEWMTWFSEQSFWASVYHHQAFLAQFESQGSSANNHLLGEIAGLYVASLTWPVFAESAHWQHEAKTILEREMPLQVFPSGVNREMGFEYHFFSTELFLLPAVLGAGRGDAFSGSYLERLGLKIKAAAWLRDARGHWPRYGDADEGIAVQLEARTFDRFHRLIEVGRRWLKVPVAQLEAVPVELRGGQLYANLVVTTNLEQTASQSEPVPNSFAFSDAGLYAMAVNRGSLEPGREEILVLADAGPLGYLSIAGHGHADALSFTLNVGGQPVLIDPGTFVYHTDVPWRKHFKSTAAHNTLVLDAQDQSTMQGAFLWSHKANTTVQSWKPEVEGGSFVASHDGYQRLAGNPTHQRKLELGGRRLTVLDRVSGEGAHEAALFWHFHPDCEVHQLEPGVWVVRWNGGKARFEFDPRLTISAHRGETEPRIGWYSPRFDLKVPTWTLRAVAGGSLPLEFRTIIDVQ
jgi:hypothetical protein